MSQIEMTTVCPQICSVCRNYNPVLSSFMTLSRVTWRVPHVEQELSTLLEYLSWYPGF